VSDQLVEGGRRRGRQQAGDDRGENAESRELKKLIRSVRAVPLLPPVLDRVTAMTAGRLARLLANHKGRLETRSS